MTDDGIFTKNADIQARCGTGANATAKAIAATDVYVLNIESYINCITRFNWSDAFTAGLNVDVQGILTEVGACLCAIYVIQWDMSGFSTRFEAEDMINVLYQRAMDGLNLLKEQSVKTFMDKA